MTERQEPNGSPPSISVGAKARLAIIALALYTIAVPLAVAKILAAGAALAGPPFAAEELPLLALAMALAGPVLGAITLALRGYERTATDMIERPDSEPQQAIVRLFIAGAALAYLAVLVSLGKGSAVILPLLAVDLAGVLSGWLLFVHLLADPKPSLIRRAAAIVNDVVLVSAFLHIGGEYTAPWFSIYLWVVLGFGFRFGVKPLLWCAALSVIGFAAVYETTLYWQLHRAAAAGVGLALVLLPAYAAALARGLTNAKAEAEKASAAKSRFLAVMSHELRTPLNSVIGMGSLIARTKLDAEQRDMLATMQHAARALLGLINDLLDLSKLEAGKLKPPQESFVLHEVMGGAMAIVRPQAEAKRLALTLRIDPRLPHLYRGFPLQLRQVLVNLLANAIKFTTKGRVAMTAALVAQEGESVRLAIAVKDEGIGISPAARERIFEIFTQADEAVTRRFGGTGLGLAIAKQLTELMGGTISLQSEIGKGSTFTVTVTLDQDPSDGLRPPELHGHKLMLISSDSALVGAIESKLRSWHGDARWIADGEAALEDLARAGTTQRPSVVIIDGRENPLAGLSLAHRATSATMIAPQILFLAPAQGGEAITSLAATQLAAVIEAPMSDADLASALLGMLAGIEPPLASENTAETAAASPTTTASHAVAKRLKILVADDNPANCKILKGVLENAGHEVEVVDDGEAALAALDRGRFDLALLDINMPEVSGYEVAKLYRVGHIGEWRLPIVALTADATTETERLCREAGMDAVMTKPVEAGQLLGTLAALHADALQPERVAVGAAPVVTPITVHPRFVPDSGAVVDESTIQALKNLGGSEFVLEVVDTFRKDAWRLIDQLRQVAEKGEMREFRELLHSMRSGAVNVGGIKLCQILTTLRDVSAKELRANGASYVEKIESELSRLDTMLGQLTEAQRHG